MSSLNAGITRRDFARIAAAGSAALIAPVKTLAQALADTPPSGSGEAKWEAVRAQFTLNRDLAFFNAANLCPVSLPVRDALASASSAIDRDPSTATKNRQLQGKEDTRKALAEWLRGSPDEILVTRNTSEANNLVSSGLDLHAGDEVVIFSDNHPSNNAAWREKAKRFGFAVKVVDAVNPHPGGDYYLEAFAHQTTTRTRVWAFTHLTNVAGDLLPARELCRAARERGILTLVDGAQSFGLLDVNLSEMQPDFYSGSAHKWPCGPRETGVLYVRRDVQPRLRASIVSAYSGSIGLSKSHEGFGQRDEAAIVAFAEALRFQTGVGRSAIETRARELAQAFIEDLKKIDGVKIWTHPSPDRSAAVVTFVPGALDPPKLGAALYERERIACAVRGGKDRPGLRFSPHFYNLHSEVERTIDAVSKYLRSGV